MKKISEKNLNLKEWKTAGPEVLEKTKARNASLRAAKGRKDEKFTARLSTADFDALRVAADDEGMGYQTLLGSIVHKYVTGQLVDLKVAQQIAGLNKRMTAKKSS